MHSLCFDWLALCTGYAVPSCGHLNRHNSWKPFSQNILGYGGDLLSVHGPNNAFSAIKAALTQANVSLGLATRPARLRVRHPILSFPIHTVPEGIPSTSKTFKSVISTVKRHARSLSAVATRRSLAKDRCEVALDGHQHAYMTTRMARRYGF